MRNILIIALIFCAIACLNQPAHAASNGNALSAEEAKAVLKELSPDLKVISVVQAPVNGLWEIALETGGKKIIVYLDYDKKHLFSGNIINIKTKENLTQESVQKINKVDVSKIPLKDALVLGDKNAKNKIVVFDDPD